MASTPLASICQNSDRLAAPGNRQPIPTIAIGSDGDARPSAGRPDAATSGRSPARRLTQALNRRVVVDQRGRKLAAEPLRKFRCEFDRVARREPEPGERRLNVYLAGVDAEALGNSFDQQVPDGAGRRRFCNRGG